MCPCRARTRGPRSAPAPCLHNPWLHYNANLSRLSPRPSELQGSSSLCLLPRSPRFFHTSTSHVQAGTRVCWTSVRRSVGLPVVHLHHPQGRRYVGHASPRKEVLYSTSTLPGWTTGCFPCIYLLLCCISRGGPKARQISHTSSPFSPPAPPAFFPEYLPCLSLAILYSWSSDKQYL